MVLVDLDDLAFGQPHMFRAANQVVQLEHIIVAGRDVTGHAGTCKLLLGIREPALSSLLDL